MRRPPVQMATMGGKKRISLHRAASMAAAITANPDGYSAPMKRACTGGTENGMAFSTRSGMKNPHVPTQTVSRATAAKYSRPPAPTGLAS